MLTLQKIETMSDIAKANEYIRTNIFGWNENSVFELNFQNPFKMLGDAIRFRIPTMTGM